MNKLRFLKTNCITFLKNSIKENLERYRDGDFIDLLDDFQSDFLVDYSVLYSIQVPEDSDTKDTQNCIVVNEALHQLTPFAARDERLWAHLCHGPLLEYSRKRWPIPSDDNKAILNIRSHFLAGNKRDLEARNSVARLFWLANIASRIGDLPLQKSLELILYRQDVRQNVIERPTVLQAEPILISVVNNLKISWDTDKKLFERDVFRNLQERLNAYCGYTFIESLPQKKVQEIVDSLVNDVVSEI